MQSSEWHTVSSPRPKKSCHIKYKIKVMLIAFFENEGVMQHDFISTGHTVNGTWHIKFLKRLKEAIQCKRHAKSQGGLLLVTASRQCFLPIIDCCRDMALSKELSTLPLASLLTRFSTIEFLDLPQDQNRSLKVTVLTS